MKTQYIIAQATVISATVLMLGTACSSHKTPANMKPDAQSLTNTQSAAAGQSWEAPASIKGKTFSFAAPYYRATFDRTGSDLGTYPCDPKTIVWKWGNKHAEEKTGDEFSEKTYEYKKNGSKTAELSRDEISGYVDGHIKYTTHEVDTFNLQFETPTSGTCTMSHWVHAPGSGPETHTASGRFTLK